jgi:UDP-galactopyranose mutase
MVKYLKRGFMQEIIVAGAGIWGCTIARVLAEAGRKVKVIESRNVVGGNVRCETDPSTGIEIHIYGSHIFHTSIPQVWQFVNRFVSFNGYQHKVLAKHKNEMYFLPLGLALVNQFYKKNLTPEELPGFIAGESTFCEEPKNFEEQAISFIGEKLYNAFIRNYTAKQWGCDPKKLSSEIIKRLPVRSSYDINYFSDYNQGIPLSGYNSLFDRLLDHENISLELNRAFTLKDVEEFRDAKIFYSGPIDQLFAYKFGALPWRSLRFETERVKVPDVQGTSVVNYVDDDVEFTRQHEYKHYHPEQKDVMAHGETIICREYPKTWVKGDEPYYPVDNEESRALLAKYVTESEKYPNLTIGGRLGQYKYFDMDKSIDSALKTANAFLDEHQRRENV